RGVLSAGTFPRTPLEGSRPLLSHTSLRQSPNSCPSLLVSDSVVREEGLVPAAGFARTGLRPAVAFCRRGRFPAPLLRVLVLSSRTPRFDSLRTLVQVSWSLIRSCERRDSNPHGFPHGILSPARLPVPPLSRRLGSWRIVFPVSSLDPTLAREP